MKDGKPASKISADKKQKAAERRKSHHPVSLGANASGVWNDDIRAQAVEYLKGKIQEQQEKVKEFETLIEHTTSFIAARLHSENNIGKLLAVPLDQSDSDEFELAPSSFLYHFSCFFADLSLLYHQGLFFP
jgi:hypothetical protein